MLGAVRPMSKSLVPHSWRPFSSAQIEAVEAKRGLSLCDTKAWHGRREAERPLLVHAASADPKTAAAAVGTATEFDL